MRLVPLCFVLLCACSTRPRSASNADAPLDDTATPDNDPTTPLELRVAGVARGLDGVQAAASRMPVGGSLPGDTGFPPLDSGIGGDSGATEPIEACAEGDVTALQDSSVVDASGATAWFVVPPIFDLAYNEGETGYVARPVTIVAVTSSGCAELAVLPDADSEKFQTGFGSTIDGMANRFVAPAGLMTTLLDQGDDLWLFSNNSLTWWTIDTTVGAVVEQAAFDAPVAGAALDESGGAWVSLLPQLPWPEDSGTAVAAQVVEVDGTGVATGVQWTLPFDPVSTGFGRLAEDPPTSGSSSFSTMLTPHFLSNALARDDAGTLWVIDSESATLAAVDPADGSSSTFTLAVVYPTGIVWEDAQLVVTSGLEGDRATNTIVATPAVHTVSTTDGSLTASVDLPEPADGWNLSRGFVSLTGTSQTQGIYRDGWLGLSGTGGGALLVTDPKGGQLVVVE